MERRIVELDEEGRKPACVIMEAAMMNLGVVLPEPGYLEAVRDITRTPRHRADLRRGQDRPVHRRRAARPSASASRPTWSRWPRRSAAACRRARSARPRRSCRSSRTAPSTRWAPTTGTRSAMAATRANLARGPHARGLRAPRPPQRPPPRRLRGASSSKYSLPGLRGRHRLEGLRDVRDRRRSSTTRRSRPTRTPSSPTSPGCST